MGVMGKMMMMPTGRQMFVVNTWPKGVVPFTLSPSFSKLIFVKYYIAKHTYITHSFCKLKPLQSGEGFCKQWINTIETLVFDSLHELIK